MAKLRISTGLVVLVLAIVGAMYWDDIVDGLKDVEALKLAEEFAVNACHNASTPICADLLKKLQKEVSFSDDLQDNKILLLMAVAGAVVQYLNG